MAVGLTHARDGNAWSHGELGLVGHLHDVFFLSLNCTASPLIPGTQVPFSACCALAPFPDESMRKLEEGEQSSKCQKPERSKAAAPASRMPPFPALPPMPPSMKEPPTRQSRRNCPRFRNCLLCPVDPPKPPALPPLPPAPKAPAKPRTRLGSRRSATRRTARSRHPAFRYRRLPQGAEVSEPENVLTIPPGSPIVTSPERLGVLVVRLGGELVGRSTRRRDEHRRAPNGPIGDCFSSEGMIFGLFTAFVSHEVLSRSGGALLLIIDRRWEPGRTTDTNPPRSHAHSTSTATNMPVDDLVARCVESERFARHFSSD